MSGEPMEAVERLRVEARKAIAHFTMVVEAGVPAQFPQWAKDAIDVAEIAAKALSEARTVAPRSRTL
jgi:hypothetical protein